MIPHVTHEYEDMSECLCGAKFLLRGDAVDHQRKTKHRWIKRTSLKIDPKYRHKIDKSAYSMPKHKDYWEVA